MPTAKRRLLFCLAALGTSLARAQRMAIVHTWPWKHCAEAGWRVLAEQGSALDGAEAAALLAEADFAIDSVGPGHHPDTNGETTLDGMLFDADTMSIAAVGALREVSSAVAVARLVMKHTKHTLLVGSQATEFAVAFGGLRRTPLNSTESTADYVAWRGAGCQPNYYADTSPPQDASCGPYTPADESPPPPQAPPPAPADWSQAQRLRLSGPDAGRAVALGTEKVAARRAALATTAAVGSRVERPRLSPEMHDTISALTVDARGSIACATSTNGLTHKVAGRVGDGAIPGAGNYAARGVGACGATGDGDILMRFLPCYQAVESLRLGASPREAAEDALARVAPFFPLFQGAVVVLAADGAHMPWLRVLLSGTHGAAAYNWHFQYSARTEGDAEAVVVDVPPTAAGELRWFDPRKTPQEAGSVVLVEGNWTAAAAAAGGEEGEEAAAAAAGRI